MPVIEAFSLVEQLAWQLWTLGATKEVCSQLLLLSESEFPNPKSATLWHKRCMDLLSRQLAAKYSPASTALAASSGGGSGAAAQQRQEGSMGKCPREPLRAAARFCSCNALRGAFWLH